MFHGSDVDRVYASDFARTTRLESDRRYLAEQMASLTLRVNEMEVHMGITQCWQPSDKPYLETIQYRDLREYHRALDQLQKLVVQRLFELQRLYISQTGKQFNSFIQSMINVFARLQDVLAHREIATEQVSGHPERRHEVQCRSYEGQSPHSRLVACIPLHFPGRFHTLA